MTILDAKLEDLRNQGYDVDAIGKELADPSRADQSQPEPQAANPPKANAVDAPFTFPFWNPFRGQGKLDHSKMDEMATKALKLCDSDHSAQRQEKQEQKAGKKKRDVTYCDSRRTSLDRCKNHDKKGMPFFKATNLRREPPEEELETFSCILEDLSELFGLTSNLLHIFWQPSDTELMGFNRNEAIYLNLAHYCKKHHTPTPTDDSQVATYAAWYFIIAHEIAHNKVFFHDEDHELLVSFIAQRGLIGLKELLHKKAPKARNKALDPPPDN